MRNIDMAEIGGVEYRLRDSAAQAMLAPEYSAATAYATGDWVRRDGALYRCEADVAAGEAWNGTKWSKLTLGEALARLAARVSALENE